MDFLSFFVGLWVGGVIGIVVMALMRAGRDPKSAPMPAAPASPEASAFEAAKDPK